MSVLQAWKSWRWDRRIAVLVVAAALTHWVAVVCAGPVLLAMVVGLWPASGLAGGMDPQAGFALFLAWLTTFVIASVVLAVALEMHDAVMAGSAAQPRELPRTATADCVVRSAFRLATAIRGDRLGER